MRLRDALNGLKNKDLEVEKIEAMLDQFGPDDKLIEMIEAYHAHRLGSASFIRIADIIESLDITASDEKHIASKIDKMSMDNFYTLLINMKLSRPELIFFIKNSIAKDDEIIKAFDIMRLPDLIDVAVRWRPKLFQGPLEKYISLYGISKKKIEKCRERCQLDQKFKFLL